MRAHPKACSAQAVAAALLLLLSTQLVLALATSNEEAPDLQPNSRKKCKKVRFATFNTSLNRNKGGELLKDLSTRGNKQAQQVAHILQIIQPDVLLLNEFDYEPHQAAARLFQRNYLAVPQADGLEPLHLPHVYVDTVNTGVPSGRDFDHDGKREGPADCYGYGFHPGQYGMVVMSRFPIKAGSVRTFQLFLWRDMPGALLPMDPATGQPWYSAEDLEVFRLSSKSHWDLPLVIPLNEPCQPEQGEGEQSGSSSGPAIDSRVQRDGAAALGGTGSLGGGSSSSSGPGGAHAASWIGKNRSSSRSRSDAAEGAPWPVRSKVVHFLVHHPTPPVFDGPEHRNRLRNNDEIRFFADYVGCSRDGSSSSSSSYMHDDTGKRGPLKPGASFVIAGDHNADPADGQSQDHAIQQLLQCPAIDASFTPTSEGGREKGNTRPGDITPPETKTSDFDLRVDYVLPSRDIPVLGGAVFWPVKAEPLSQLLQCSDHRPVYMDLLITGDAATQEHVVQQ